MGVKTNAVLTALNLILGNKLRQEEIAREDQRKLDNIKKEYIQKQTLRRDFEPEAVEAEIAKNRQITNQANLYNDNIREISDIYRLNLANEKNNSIFNSRYQPELNEYNYKELMNKKGLQPHQNEYNLLKVRKDIEDLLAAPEREAEKRELEKKLGAGKLQLLYQQIANAKAKGDRLKALGSLSAAGGGKGGISNPKFVDLLREYIKIQDSMENIRKNSQTDGSDYLNVSGYKDLEAKAIQLDKYMRYLYPEFNPQDPAAIQKVLGEATDIGGAEGNIDKAIAAEASGLLDNSKEAAAKPATPKQQEGYDERGIFGYIDDAIADKERGIKKSRSATRDRLASRTDDYYKTDKPYGWTGKYGRDIYNAIRQTRDSIRKGAYLDEGISPVNFLPPPIGQSAQLSLMLSKLLGF